MWDILTLRAQYLLTEVTCQPRYAQAADEALQLFQQDSGLLRAAVTIHAEDGQLRFEPYDYYNNHTGVQKLVYALLQLHLLKSE